MQETIIPSVSKVNSAGFVIRTMNDGKWYYLLCHASGRGATKGYGIPKGKQDKGEDLLVTAYRETQEETGLDVKKLDKDLIEVGNSVYFTYTLKDKIVWVYTLSDSYGDLIDYKFHCPSEHSPGVPEIDEYLWLTIDKAIQLATESQKGLFKHIKAYGI